MQFTVIQLWKQQPAVYKMGCWFLQCPKWAVGPKWAAVWPLLTINPQRGALDCLPVSPKWQLRGFKIVFFTLTSFELTLDYKIKTMIDLLFNLQYNDNKNQLHQSIVKYGMNEYYKAVNMTASVAYGWVGTVTQVKLPFGVFLHCVTDRPTNRQTNRPTESRVRSWSAVTLRDHRYANVLQNKEL